MLNKTKGVIQMDKSTKKLISEIICARKLIRKMYVSHMLREKVQVPICKNIYGKYGYHFESHGTLEIGDILNKGTKNAKKVCYIISYKDACYA